jgi:hypothetical protein
MKHPASPFLTWPYSVPGVGIYPIDARTFGDDRRSPYWGAISTPQCSAFYLDQGGLIPFILEYAMSCPRCSCMSATIPSDVATIV